MGDIALPIVDLTSPAAIVAFTVTFGVGAVAVFVVICAWFCYEYQEERDYLMDTYE